MAETGKLIDADALMRWTRKSIERKCSDESLDPVFNIALSVFEGKIEAQPDASELLRKRIAELEGALDDLVCACELPGDHCEVEDALPAARAALLKGGQDA